MTKPRCGSRKSVCFGALKFPLFFPSEEQRRDISLDKCSATSVELLVPLIVLKISWEQVLIQNKGRETRKDFSTKQISQKGEHLLEILVESILEIFWIREPGFDPELCLPETPLFHLLFYFPPYCALSVSIVRVFTVVNSPSTIRFVVVW